MGFLNIQILIFLSTIIASLVAGKKGTLAAIVIWGIQTSIIYRDLSFGYLQIIVLGISFQIGMLIGLARDFISKRITLRKKVQ